MFDEYGKDTLFLEDRLLGEALSSLFCIICHKLGIMRNILKREGSKELQKKGLTSIEFEISQYCANTFSSFAIYNNFPLINVFLLYCVLDF